MSSHRRIGARKPRQGAVDPREGAHPDVSHTRAWTVVVGLAAIALVLHALDLWTGVHGMQRYGLSFEQNPVARALFVTAGPAGVTAAKLGTVLAGVYVLIRIARRGQVRLAGSGLTVVALLGLLGTLSNAAGRV